MDVRTLIRNHFSKAIAEPICDEDYIFKLGAVGLRFAIQNIQLVQFFENEFSITAERRVWTSATFARSLP